MKKGLLGLGCVLASLVVPVYAASPSERMDSEKDDFLLGRYPGSVGLSHSHNDYIEGVFLQGLNSYEDPENWEHSAVIGENTVAIYSLAKDGGVSTKKVFRSIEKNLVDAGAKTAISCSGVKRECGYYFPRRLVGTQERKSYYDNLDGFFTLNYGNFYFYTGNLVVEDDNYYVSVIVSGIKNDEIQYSVDIIKEVEDDYVNLITTTTAIEKSIDETGRAVLGGLYFATDQTKLTAASDAALNNIVSYLQKNADRAYLVVGHTDDVGDDDYNLALSKGRSQAVITRLASAHDIDDIDLQALGLGSHAPVAANLSGEGRAENRRVELVLASSLEGEVALEKSKSLSSSSEVKITLESKVEVETDSGLEVDVETSIEANVEPILDVDIETEADEE